MATKQQEHRVHISLHSQITSTAVATQDLKRDDSFNVLIHFVAVIVAHFHCHRPVVGSVQIIYRSLFITHFVGRLNTHRRCAPITIQSRYSNNDQCAHDHRQNDI